MAVRRITTKGNKPGEPPFKLELDHKEVLNMRWEKSSSSTFTDIKMTNQFDEFQTFKVKCTDNAIFRVRPPMGTIEPKTSINIRVIQHALEKPQPNKHFVALLHMKCTAADAKKGTWKNIWQNPSAKPDGVIRIPIVFVDTPAAAGTASAAPAPATEATAAPSVAAPTA